MISTSFIASVLKKNQSVTIVAQGNSMKPLINSGTKITIIPCKFTDIKLYDIVAIKNKDQIVIHQCLYRNSKYIICKGSNNLFIDPPAFSNQLLGYVKSQNYWQMLNMAYDYELQLIHRLLPNTPIMVLKGATWQKNFYGYYLNRQPSDIDILIKKTDYHLIHKTLKSLGYRTRQQKLPQSELTFTKIINHQKLNIDIHFQCIRSALNPFFRQPIDRVKMDQLTNEFWFTAYKNNNLFFMKNEYLLFYFCLNIFFHHGVRGVKILANIADIITKEKINWSNFWLLANKYQMTNFVYYPLIWTAYFFKIKIPDLNSYRPNLLRKILIKPFINHYTIFHPFLNLGMNQIAAQFNLKLITIMRIILYQSPTPKDHKPKYSPISGT